MFELPIWLWVLIGIAALIILLIVAVFIVKIVQYSYRRRAKVHSLPAGATNNYSGGGGAELRALEAQFRPDTEWNRDSLAATNRQ